MIEYLSVKRKTGNSKVLFQDKSLGGASNFIQKSPLVITEIMIRYEKFTDSIVEPTEPTAKPTKLSEDQEGKKLSLFSKKGGSL